ncbi:hypothetical protein ACIG3E_33130 [Streptomyces sp. NPDC053474]|uniref:hypothetical protein n=1 Tax=Streptomyces sp. NPDC053474 TaxID=3365704 RepID=UPI0037D2690B
MIHLPGGTMNPPPYDRTAPSRSGCALVNWHLEQLHLGGLYLDFTKVPRSIPEGLGWCRARPLPEELWPARAELAVIVHFHPDPLFRRNPKTQAVPAGAVQHWTQRLDACATALATRGFVIEEWGVPMTPELHSGADLIAYRLPPGIAPAPRSPADLLYAHPPRPNFRSEGSKTALWKLHSVLSRAEPPLWRDNQAADTATGTGRCLVYAVDENLWPPGTTDCHLVTWEPDPPYRRNPNRPLKHQGAYAHWAQGIAHLTRTLVDADYVIRRRERPSNPDLDNSITFLVYDEIPPGTTPAPGAYGGRPATRPRWAPARP